MLWLWAIPNTYPNKRIGTIVKNSGTDRFEFLKGTIMDDSIVESPRINFKCDEKYLLDVLPSNGGLLIVSEKVLQILKKLCPEDIQEFKANVFAKEKFIDGYFLLNITNTVDVFDSEKCEFSKYMGAITAIKKIAYKTDSLSEHDIARNAEFKSHVLVSDRLKDIFEKEKIKGVEFRDATIVV